MINYISLFLFSLGLDDIPTECSGDVKFPRKQYRRRGKLNAEQVAALRKKRQEQKKITDAARWMNQTLRAPR